MNQNDRAGGGELKKKRWHEYVEWRHGWISVKRSKERGKIKMGNGI